MGGVLIRAVCSVDRCGRPVLALGLCQRHYKRRRRGAPLTDDRPETGSPSGHGRYGILDEDPASGLVQCHECGRWYRSVAAHLSAGHGMTPRDYRRRHGLPAGTALIASAVSAALSASATARVGTPAWRRLEEARDPVAAAHARDQDALHGRARVDREAAAARALVTGRRRGEQLRECAACGVEWCALPGGYRRVTCSDECMRVVLAWAGQRPPVHPERDARIYALVTRLRRPREEVAALYGITSQRVGQIVRRLRDVSGSGT